MASVNAYSRNARSSEERKFKGGGSRFQNGDTLMARITPCLENGKIARYQAQGDKREAHGSTEFIVIRGRPNVTDNDFAYYLTQWEKVRNYAIEQMTGTSGRQRVPTDSLDYLTVPLPPLAEQRAIAHVLGTLDDKIELNRRMNETLEAMAQALFQDWFVDFGPVRAKLEGREPYLPPEVWSLFPDRRADSELGETPEGWEVRRLGEVVEHLRNNENPFKDPETIFTHFSIPAYDEGQMPRQELGANIKSAKSRVPHGSVLLSRLNPEIARVWLVDVPLDDRAVCSTEFMILGAKSHLRRCYIYCIGLSKPFRQRLESLVTGTSGSHQRVPASAVLSLNVAVPPVHVIEAFETLAAALLDHTLANRRESHVLAAQRDTLLPSLMSGEVQI